MNIKHPIYFFMLAISALTAHATTQILVTSQEFAASENAPAIFQPKFVPEKDAPKIDVAVPDLAKSLVSPMPIQLNFYAVSPATIKPSSFKVLYGSLQFDITQRLLSAAIVTPLGIRMTEASLPSGKHRLQLSVEDSSGRKGYRVIEFQVN
jgi:hypothetical protein